MRQGLYDGACPNLLRGEKALILDRPFLLIGTSAVLGPELPSRSIAYSGGCLYIFLIYCFITLNVCEKILLPLRFGWLCVLKSICVSF